MSKATGLTKAALGAGLMYFFDPRLGARRRAMFRDTVTRLSHKTRDRIDVTRRDVRNRMQGVKAGVSSLFSSSSAVDDDQLAGRIRSHLGRIASHPRHPRGSPRRLHHFERARAVERSTASVQRRAQRSWRQAR